MAGSPACKGAGQLSAAAGLTLLCDVTSAQVTICASLLMRWLRAL